LHFLFYVNHGYRYFDVGRIHVSPIALFWINGAELNPEVLNLYLHQSPESFSIVRDPLRRFVSGFLSKIFTAEDNAYVQARDNLTSLCNVDLSPEADPAQSCLSFARWVAAQDDQRALDEHFRPQHINLMMGGRFTVDTILHLEDREALLAFFTRWIGAEKAQWFISLRYNEQTKYRFEDVTTDELAALVRKIYARDYELFYR